MRSPPCILSLELHYSLSPSQLSVRLHSDLLGQTERREKETRERESRGGSTLFFSVRLVANSKNCHPPPRREGTSASLQLFRPSSLLLSPLPCFPSPNHTSTNRHPTALPQQQQLQQPGGKRKRTEKNGPSRRGRPRPARRLGRDQRQRSSGGQQRRRRSQGQGQGYSCRCRSFPREARLRRRRVL